jgi:hypothetical protein
VVTVRLELRHACGLLFALSAVLQAFACATEVITLEGHACPDGVCDDSLLCCDGVCRAPSACTVSGGGGGGGAGGAAGGAPQTCTCSPTIPAPWTAARRETLASGMAPENCLSFETTLDLFSAPPSAADVECDTSACECPVESSGCYASKLIAWANPNQGNCFYTGVSSYQEVSVNADDCVLAFDSARSIRIMNGVIAGYAPQSATCMPDDLAAAVVKPQDDGEPEWRAHGYGTRHRLCMTAEPGECGADRTCLSSDTCVWAPDPAGTLECPADWPVVVDAFQHQAADDQRGCECACETTTVTTCDIGNANFYQDSGCGGASLGFVQPTNTCTIITGTGQTYMRWDATPVPSECDTTSTPTGAFVPSSPIKICCLE